MVQNVLGKDVFLTVHPKEGEGLLGAVQDLREEAQLTILISLLAIEDLVCLGKFLSIFFGDRCDCQYFIESLHTYKESAARGSPLISIEFKLPHPLDFIFSLDQVLSHHDSLFKGLIAEAPLELLDLFSSLFV